MSADFKKISDLIKYMANLEPGEAYEAFRRSIVNDFVEHGYSPERAEQVIDEMVRHFRQSPKT
jgi:hypothetical protein